MAIHHTSILNIWGLWCQKQVSQAGISNYIPQVTVGCNYLSLPEITAADTKVLIFWWYVLDMYLDSFLAYETYTVNSILIYNDTWVLNDSPGSFMVKLTVGKSPNSCLAKINRKYKNTFAFSVISGLWKSLRCRYLVPTYRMGHIQHLNLEWIWMDGFKIFPHVKTKTCLCIVNTMAFDALGPCIAGINRIWPHGNLTRGSLFYYGKVTHPIENWPPSSIHKQMIFL